MGIQIAIHSNLKMQKIFRLYFMYNKIGATETHKHRQMQRYFVLSAIIAL